MSMKLIITMTSVTVASAVAEKVFASVGKNDMAQYLDLATKSGMGATALGVFAGFIKVLAGF